MNLSRPWESESHVAPPFCEQIAFASAKRDIPLGRRREVTNCKGDGVLVVFGREVLRVMLQAEREEIGTGVEAGI